MNILVCLNSNYINPLKGMLSSLIQAERGEALDIYVMHSTLTESDLENIGEALDGTSARLFDIKVPRELGNTGFHKKRLSVETFYRLFAPWLLPKNLERILYLDPDITIINSVRSLYDCDLSGMCYAAASHMFSPMQKINRIRLKMAKNSLYVNAGVLMMNLPELRKAFSQREITAYIEKMGNRLYLSDQDVINGLYSRKTVYVDPKKFNLDEKYFKLYNLDPYVKDKIDLEWVAANTSVIHFCGKDKPWNEDYKGDFGGFYKPFEKREIETVTAEAV